MIKEIVCNDENNSLFNKLKELNEKEKIMKLDIYVGYSNFVTIFKIFDLFKNNDNDVNIKIYYSKNTSKNFIFNENIFEMNDKTIEYIVFEIFNTLYNIDDNNNIFQLSSKKIKEKFGNIYNFHGKIFKIETCEDNKYIIIGSSNLTLTGLGIVPYLHNNDFFLNEVNYFTDDKEIVSMVEEWENKLFDNFSVKNNPILKEYHEIFFKDLIKYYCCKISGFTSDINDSISNFNNNSITRKKLKPYQAATLDKILRAMIYFGGSVLNYDVGLGKTHIGLAVYDFFKNYLNQNVKIVVPPGLEDEWKKYKFYDDNNKKFSVRESDIIKQTENEEKILDSLSDATVLIIDEAHKYRNNDTLRRRKIINYFYKRNNENNDFNIHWNDVQGKYVLLITATPYNNSEEEVQNLINLFGEQSLADKTNFIELSKIWKNKNKIFDSRNIKITGDNKDIEIDDKLKKFILFFFNRLNKSTWRYSTTNKENCYFAQISNLGKHNLNFIMLDDKDFCNSNNEIQVDSFKSIYSELIDKINQISNDELFSWKANSLIKNNFLISLNSSVKSFFISLESTIKKLERNIELYKKNPQNYKHQYKKRKFEQEIDDIEEILTDDDLKIDKDDYYFPEDFIKEYVNDKSNKFIKLNNLKEWLKKYKLDILNNNSFIDLKFNYLEYLLNKYVDNLNKRKAIIFCSRVATVDELCKKIINSSLVDDNDVVIGATTKGVKLYKKDGTIINKCERTTKKEIEEIKYLFSPISSKNDGVKDYNNLTIDKNYNYKYLITTDIFAEGHNIQDATIIINYDHHYNPMVIMQRIGRVDRFRDYDSVLEYNNDLYKMIYIFNIWIDAKLVNEVMHSSVKKKTLLADMLGSDTHKFYIHPDYVDEYSLKKDTQNKSQYENNEYETIDQILATKYKNNKYKVYDDARKDIEDNNPEYFIFKGTQNGLIIEYEINGKTYLMLFDQGYNVFHDNYKLIAKLWNEGEYVNIQDVYSIRNYGDYFIWLEKLKNNNLISKSEILKEKIYQNFIEIKKIIYLLKEK